MIKDPWTVLDRLWDQWEGDDLAPINCRLEVDPRTLHDLQSDWRQWNNNVQMIGANGDPVMEYRGRFTIIPVRHYDLPDISTFSSRSDTLARCPTPHLALVYTKRNGRQVALDWEGNHADLKA